MQKQIIQRIQIKQNKNNRPDTVYVLGYLPKPMESGKSYN
jgi:hypothetical protein